ncbi:MAG: biotin--[acetyl-CoA-carboxylase] ligase, partial [Planctomycetota bacterium]
MEFRIFEHSVVDSTSERAFHALSASTAHHGDLHVAREQLAGRGRRGAKWFSAADQGLYASLMLRTPRILEPAAVTMGAGLAVLATLRELGLARAELKWPNDLQVGGSKLCGILAETRGLDPAAPHCVVGIGINVGQREFPPELTGIRAVTSLALCGIDTDPRAVLASLMPHLAREMERVERDPAATVTAYFAATGLVDHRVRVQSGDSEIEGSWRELGLA